MAESLRVAPRRALSQKIGEHPTTLSRLHGSNSKSQLSNGSGAKRCLNEKGVPSLLRDGTRVP